MKFSQIPRIYANIKLIESRLLELPEDNAHYHKTVLRLRAGDCVRIFNNKDGEFIAQIINITKSNLSAQITNIFRTAIPLEAEIILGLSIIKNDRMLDAISMAVQLGVTQIVPLITQRVQSGNINNQKLSKCIIEYTQQSERLAPPTLEPAMSLPLFLKRYYNNFILYANENEDDNNTLLRFMKTLPVRVVLIIGPEGGYSDSELKLLDSTDNCYSISLGASVLRTETAVAACLAQIQLLRCKQNV
ncbi:unnamed protein product [Didymodactylos carnosus]|uniref:16S rRNA (uracil(1498)-N(3))-methyltransferase n=1 Tax=Didymodactylos carnosus TaxID=1234261 RepID=A0A815BE22_9BILA|nr:unnamed protein product [Didymodactylos carnosus]CAF1271249.1 unnamed protein product [Didymodactylos carnosus]CAF3512449.1 unnamed protein product [Didymodactylos carnosus]CAF4059384.1 unnamed protein product [Didymodactylos carnosus]